MVVHTCILTTKNFLQTVGLGRAYHGWGVLVWLHAVDCIVQARRNVVWFVKAHLFLKFSKHQWWNHARSGRRHRSKASWMRWEVAEVKWNKQLRYSSSCDMHACTVAPPQDITCNPLCAIPCMLHQAPMDAGRIIRAACMRMSQRDNTLQLLCKFFIITCNRKLSSKCRQTLLLSMHAILWHEFDRV